MAKVVMRLVGNQLVPEATKLVLPKTGSTCSIEPSRSPYNAIREVSDAFPLIQRRRIDESLNRDIAERELNRLQDAVSYAFNNLHRRGFQVATQTSLAEAARLIEICQRHFELFVSSRERGASFETSRRDFYVELSKVLNFDEPYSSKAFDRLMLVELVGRLAELGIVLPGELSVCGDSDKQDELICFYYNRQDFAWAVTGIKEMQIEDLDGQTEKAKVHFVKPVLGKDYGSSGFAQHGSILINESQDDSITNRHFYKRQYADHLILRSPLSNVIDFLTRMDSKYPASNSNEQIVRALHFSNCRILNNATFTEETHLREKQREIVHHEHQHTNDEKNPSLVGIERDKNSYDPKAKIFSEVRAEANGFKGSPRAMLVSLIRFLLNLDKIPQEDPRIRFKYLGELHAEYLLLQAIIKVIKQNPSSFGVLVRQHSKYNEDVQILGQLDKLLKPQATELLLKGLKPYLENPNELISLFNPEEPFYKGRLIPRFA